MQSLVHVVYNSPIMNTQWMMAGLMPQQSTHPFFVNSVLHSFNLISFLSFPFLTSLSTLESPASFPLLWSLACCHVHATSSSQLTDAWMVKAEAIRQWAEWNRTGPVHYQDSRLCLIFNLYFLWTVCQRTLSIFEQNPALLCFRGVLTFCIPVCSFSSAGHLSQVPSENCVFFPFSTVWQSPAEETDPNSKCHQDLWNNIVAVMWLFCNSLWQSSTSCNTLRASTSFFDIIKLLYEHSIYFMPQGIQCHIQCIRKCKKLHWGSLSWFSSSIESMQSTFESLIITSKIPLHSSALGSVSHYHYPPHQPLLAVGKLAQGVIIQTQAWVFSSQPNSVPSMHNTSSYIPMHSSSSSNSLREIM